MDLEKVYDRVEWSFLKEVLKFTSFKHELMELIMECMSTTSLAVWLNGEVLEPFFPTRDLHIYCPVYRSFESKDK